MRRSPSSGHVTTAAGASSQHVRPGVQEFNRIQVAQSTLSHRSGTYHESATEVTGTFPPPPQCLDPVSSHALGAEYTEHKICPSDYLQASRSRSSAQVAPPSPSIRRAALSCRAATTLGHGTAAPRPWGRAARGSQFCPLSLPHWRGTGQCLSFGDWFMALGTVSSGVHPRGGVGPNFLPL